MDEKVLCVVTGAPVQKKKKNVFNEILLTLEEPSGDDQKQQAASLFMARLLICWGRFSSVLYLQA